MSEGTFRAVVASVLVGALALAVIVASAVVLRQSPETSPSAPAPTGAALGPTSTPAPTGTPLPTRSSAPVFGAADVVSVGQIQRGGASGTTLVLQFLEASAAAIPDASGSFRVTLTDAAGDGTTVTFVGTPSVEAPGSLGTTARLVAANVLQLSIVASDANIVELITIRGLGIRASSTAALGPVKAELGDFTGSLATGAARNVLAPPATVIASS